MHGVHEMRAGSWVRCDPNISHKKVEVYFFRKVDYKYPFCSLCLYEVQKRNGTLPISNGNQVNTQSYINHLTKSKPGADTL